MTPKGKTSTSTTILVERKKVKQDNSSSSMHVAGGEHKGIVINKNTSTNGTEDIDELPSDLSLRVLPEASPSESENQNTVDQSAQEKFLNCRCYEDQNGEGTPSTQSGSVLAQYVIPAQYVGATNGAVLGQPFNMQDVSKTLENIKTGIESSVKGANDKISTGFSDLKTNLQHQYEQASQKSLTENLKDASDKVSQKISDLHIKDTVVNGLSDMTHKVQEKYESVTQKGLEGNMKDISNVASNDADKMKTELHHWTDGIVSQPTPNAYASGAHTVIPANQLRTKFVQAKYINSNNNLQGSPMSGNEFAPVSLVQN
ncbi:uncharacterized protein LOC103513486 [Diaphorina citri]|uniref:Uncharacterized protein LOC103513486 n=1 Tax=Diaphorina citri TaxID=121845 RepID=A0A1S4EGJ8_DIACI|nr:uncharacterized protein LOC103513486 [Diaphorina citri]